VRGERAVRGDEAAQQSKTAENGHDDETAASAAGVADIGRTVIAHGDDVRENAVRWRWGRDHFAGVPSTTGREAVIRAAHSRRDDAERVAGRIEEDAEPLARWCWLHLRSGPGPIAAERRSP